MPCACGSGLRHRSCCGAKVEAGGFATTPAPVPSDVAVAEQQALAAKAAGDIAGASRFLLDVLERDPWRPRALHLLYELRKAEGRRSAAEALIRRLLAMEPNRFGFINELVLLLLSRGAGVEAVQHARHGIRLQPSGGQAHLLMALSLTEADRPFDAEYHYLRAIEFSNRRDPAVLVNYALCLTRQGRLTQARVLYEEALVSAPEEIQALMGLARLEEADGRLDAALAWTDRALTDLPDDPGLQLLRATILMRQGRRDSVAAMLDLPGLQAARLGVRELLEKGRLFDELGRFAEAFAAFDAGKRRLREATGRSYMDRETAVEIARLKGFFTRKLLATLPRATMRADMAQPIFIVGFPRSGTTLMEQMLSAHPGISGCGELTFLQDLVRRMPLLLDSPFSYPDALSELWVSDRREELAGLRDHYLRRVGQLGLVSEGAAWFTDKMPLNEMHLGLISLLFPASPVIYVQRHPLDAVLSAYSHLLTHGGYCAYALETAALHYARTSDLVAHYRRELDMRFHAVRYEDLLDRPEESVRAVLECVGVAFDPACLRFHQNPRRAPTASYAQVREELHSRSRYRYRNYMRELERVVPILRPLMNRLGYEV